MKTLKNLIVTVLLLLTIYGLFNYSEEIIQYLMINVIYHDEILDKDANSYFKKLDYNYVQTTDNFYPNNKQDILNIFYTGLNKGFDEITFYCPTNYDDCLTDVDNLVNDNSALSYINNYVSTYNTYNKIYVNMNNFGRVNITINKIYDENTISAIDKEIDRIYNQLINENMTDEEKIRTIHDYIINHTDYDQERANEIKNNQIADDIHPSNTAYGPLFTGKAICGGYTDTMALFLDKMGIKNIKVASSNHIWNAVYINNEWKHLDLTWDDPVVINGDSTLTYNYFLINTNELKEKNDDQHNFDEKVFSELKN